MWKCLKYNNGIYQCFQSCPVFEMVQKQFHIVGESRFGFFLRQVERCTLDTQDGERSVSITLKFLNLQADFTFHKGQNYLRGEG